MKGRFITAVLLAAATAGCASNYVTPPAGVGFAEIADQDIATLYAATPASPLPANIAIVRIQDSGYVTRTVRGYGHGRYSVVTVRDIESDADYRRIGELPLVGDVAPVGRMLLPPSANSLRDLRMPAAHLHADLLLVYTVDTAFHVDGRPLGPLSLISLGLMKNRKAHVTTTVAGVLIDVRSGYVYGTAEATTREEQKTTIWSTDMVIDSARLRAEGRAFGDFVDEFGRLWKGVVDERVAAGMPSPSPVADNDSHYRIRFD